MQKNVGSDNQVWTYTHKRLSTQVEVIPNTIHDCGRGPSLCGPNLSSRDISHRLEGIQNLTVLQPPCLSPKCCWIFLCHCLSGTVDKYAPNSLYSMRTWVPRLTMPKCLGCSCHHWTHTSPGTETSAKAFFWPAFARLDHHFYFGGFGSLVTGGHDPISISMIYPKHV